MHALQINVVVYRKQPDSLISQIEYITRTDLPTVRLSYHGGIHYNFVHPLQLDLANGGLPQLPELTGTPSREHPSSTIQPSTQVPATLPPSYQYMPHLWRTIPDPATERSWNLSCNVILQQAMKAHLTNDTTRRDSALLKFLHLPRTALNKISKDRFKARKLRK